MHSASSPLQVRKTVHWTGRPRELVALGIAIACRCEDCIGFHVQTLVKLGTTRAEVEDVLGTAVYMGGGPSMMYATHALRAFEQFSS
jgi:AhpD family alkylhydroperoxidase